MMKSYRLFLFDFDGTLIDSKADIAFSINATLNDAGFRVLPAEVIHSYVGSGVDDLLFKCTGCTDQFIIDKAVNYFHEHYREHCCDQTHLYEGVADILPRLAARHPLYVLTNKPRLFTEIILKGLNADSWFRGIVAADDVAYKKPHPSGALSILQKEKVSLDETLLIGDSLIDIQTAEKAQIDMALVTYGFGHLADLKDQRIHYTANTFAELASVFGLSV